MRTDRRLLNSGQWAKVGPKHYRHESGAEVRWNPNAWGWEVGRGPLYPTLAVAAYEVEQAVARGEVGA